ncbi:MAG: DUF5597 domain-containing protein [Prevotella sp.]|nr:DUF5597 domain-containing protein [Prevotella sp.]
MKTQILILTLLMLVPALWSHGENRPQTARPKPVGTAMARLARQGSATQLVVDGRPMLMLAGELSNSSATSREDIAGWMPRMESMGLNTVLVPAQWDLIEPEEGKYDFSLIDEVIRQAETHHLKVVFLWFGAWKNSMSCYAPLWFKQDVKRFPRAMNAQGKPLEIASAFSENVFQADNKVFGRLVQHIKETDQRHSVVMLQVENEIGMLEDARDHSPLAEQEYRKTVPPSLVKYLNQVQGTHLKEGRTWAETFGTDRYADEKFMTYHYARYVERLAQTAKSIYPLPLYVNAAMNSRGRQPGEYPSAGPLAHLKDIWHQAAPSISMLAPDLYDKGFKSWVSRYALPDNPLFIPEVRYGDYSGARAMYVFGQYDCLGYSPFSIDNPPSQASRNLTSAYALLRQLMPRLLQAQGSDKPTKWGVLLDQTSRDTVMADGDVVMKCSHSYTLPWGSHPDEWPETGALILKLGKNDYLIAGSGVVTVFKHQSELSQDEKRQLGEDGFALDGTSPSETSTTRRWKGHRIGLGTVDEVTIDDNGQLQYVRRLNGDQNHQGRHVDLGDWRILHVKLYEY